MTLFNALILTQAQAPLAQAAAQASARPGSATAGLAEAMVDPEEAVRRSAAAAESHSAMLTQRIAELEQKLADEAVLRDDAARRSAAAESGAAMLTQRIAELEQRILELEQRLADATRQDAARAAQRGLVRTPQQQPGEQLRQTQTHLALITNLVLSASLQVDLVRNANQTRIRVKDMGQTLFRRQVEFAIVAQHLTTHGSIDAAADAFVSLLRARFEALPTRPETRDQSREWIDRVVTEFRFT
jgi:hypothetical protein